MNRGRLCSCPARGSREPALVANWPAIGSWFRHTLFPAIYGRCRSCLIAEPIELWIGLGLCGHAGDNRQLRHRGHAIPSYHMPGGILVEDAGSAPHASFFHDMKVRLELHL